MRRLLACLRGDVTRQYRYGLYGVSVAMVVIWGVLLSVLPDVWRSKAAAVVPAFLAINLIITTFYFTAAMVLLERGEGVLSAVVTTPLRESEYLASKVLSLTVLALLECLLIVAVVIGTGGNWALLIGASFLIGAVYALAGFIFVVRYEGINEFLMPSVVLVTLLMLPLAAHFGITGELPFIWHPVQQALILMRAAYEPVAGWKLVAAAAGLLGWAAACFLWARRQFLRFVLERAGA